MSTDRYDYLKQCAEAWFRQTLERIVREATDLLERDPYRDRALDTYVAKIILSISRAFNDSSRVFAQLVNLPAMISPHNLPPYLKEDMNRLRPLLALFGPSGNVNCDALTGLTLPEPLSFEYDDTLRFRYLAEYGLTTDGEPLDKFLGE